MPKVFVSVLLAALLWQASAHAVTIEDKWRPNLWREVAAQVSASIAKAQEALAAGKVDDARQLAREAYYKEFEELRMEGALRKEFGPKRVVQTEQLFHAFRRAVMEGDTAKAAEAAAQLHKKLAEEAAALDEEKASPQLVKAEE